MIWTLGILVLIAIATMLFLNHPKFGAKPSGKRLERIEQSPNYRDGQFQNLSETPQLTEGSSMLKVAYRQFFKGAPRKRPVDTIPSVKTDLINLPAGKNSLVWFGHSSYFMKIEGVNILVDPVFSGNASPVPGTMKSFPGTDIYGVEDLPEIDVLLISHDHYDHLDYKTIVKLRGKTKKVICGLGVGAHFEKWGFDSDRIIELDWNESVEPLPGFKLYSTPARHFSGRSFKRNNTLWLSYVLQTSSLNLFIGGDSGYDSHFSKIGKEYGTFDLAILENGQYNENWRYIHSLPNEQLKIAEALTAKRVFPVHSSKFDLANHPWDEPLIQISHNFRDASINLVTPKIGEVVELGNADQKFEKWWVGLE